VSHASLLAALDGATISWFHIKARPLLRARRLARSARRASGTCRDMGTLKAADGWAALRCT
jgi:hypothetical protein